jgi:hypothetical protein
MVKVTTNAFAMLMYVVARFISRSGTDANGSHWPAYGLAAIDPI